VRLGPLAAGIREELAGKAGGGSDRLGGLERVLRSTVERVRDALV
jgi:hypothetical protein